MRYPSPEAMHVGRGKAGGQHLKTFLVPKPGYSRLQLRLLYIQVFAAQSQSLLSKQQAWTKSRFSEVLTS